MVRPIIYNNISFETLYFEDQYEYPNDIAAINISCDDVPILENYKIKIAKRLNIEDPPNPLHGEYVNVQNRYSTSIISCIYNQPNNVDSLNTLKRQYIIDSYGDPNDLTRYDFSGCGLFSTSDRLVGFYVDDKYYLSTDEKYNQELIHSNNESI